MDKNEKKKKMTCRLNNYHRFFIKFSYNGRNYNGVAKQTDEKSITVHNVIESYMKMFGQKNSSFLLKSHLHISSRTDAGVHALLNTAHFDIMAPPLGSASLDLSGIETRLACYLNNMLIKNDHQIR